MSRSLWKLISLMKNGNGFINAYDRHWQLQPFQMEYPNARGHTQAASYQEALLAGAELGPGIDYCRVDLMPPGTRSTSVR